ncbi:hypothetical protein GMES_3168 [Paraglaciecola mesophila KMM 241]|uniref:Uncharacterized protein n=1 Tax=Paraglaciecola mesophila KMM 241 TaxID=1128912 RepID=K6Z8Z1_9ALTE|nr:hypothetical protein GMES_3168 [Paraglaciecola mesophila KMM 241]
MAGYGLPLAREGCKWRSTPSQVDLRLFNIELFDKILI